jgi:ubiquinone/menaquinone biosynthesis C-methylase UbiE
MTTPTQPQVPNHHADFPGFAGVSGLLAGLSMTVGRSPMAQWAADTCEIGPDDTVVDVGSGPGRAGREAACRGAVAIGVDPAPVMRTLARALSIGRARVSWREGSAESLPVDAASATVVWSLSTVHHWHDVDAGLDEVARVLAPNGRLLVSERRVAAGAGGLASHGWTADQAATFASMCTAHGFDAVTVERVTVGRSKLHVVRARRP